MALPQTAACRALQSAVDVAAEPAAILPVVLRRRVLVPIAAPAQSHIAAAFIFQLKYRVNLNTTATVSTFE